MRNRLQNFRKRLSVTLSKKETGIPLLAADYTLEIGNRSVPIREGQTVTLPNPGGSQLQITLKPAADASGMRTYSANGITFQYPATVRPQEVDLANGQAKLIKLTDLTMFQVLPKLDSANRKGFIDGTLKGFKTTFPGKVSDRLYPVSLTLGGKKWTGSYFKATLDNQEFRFNSYLIDHGSHLCTHAAGAVRPGRSGCGAGQTTARHLPLSGVTCLPERLVIVQKRESRLRHKSGARNRSDGSSRFRSVT